MLPHETSNASARPRATPSEDAPPRALRERVGDALGWAAAPLFAAIASIRRARVLHPDGVALRARVTPLASDASVRGVAERLRGPALVRFSSALWRVGHEHLDALGCAIRFRSDAATTARPSLGDQDLLFATIRSPFTMPLAPLTTNEHNYLSNTYHAIAPFDVPGVGRAKWRLVPELRAPDAPTRRARLLAAVTAGRATLRLELRRTWTQAWTPVARVALESVADVDQETLRFDPFRSGRGIVPRGLVHALRRGAYAASQAARPMTAEARRRAERPAEAAFTRG